MLKMFTALAVGFLMAGCTTVNLDVYSQPKAHADSACGPNGCTRPVYEISIDTWCSGACTSYPVSSLPRSTYCDEARVELRGVHRDTTCQPR
jgi:hypothetical protein